MRNRFIKSAKDKQFEESSTTTDKMKGSYVSDQVCVTISSSLEKLTLKRKNCFLYVHFLAMLEKRLWTKGTHEKKVMCGLTLLLTATH